MGWNTWCTDDACGLIDKCTEAEIMSVADAIVAQGLDQLGYRYINM
jgi:alpha-galactosidase